MALPRGLHRRGGGGIASSTTQPEHRETALAVGQHVMGPHVQRRLAALEPLDQRDVPRAAIGIERRGLEQPDELEQLAAITGRANAIVRRCARRAEVGHLDPAGPRASAGGIVEAPTQAAALAAAAASSRAITACAFGRRSRTISVPTAMRRVASWPVRHMIASMELKRSVTQRPYNPRVDAVTARPGDAIGVNAEPRARGRRRGCRGAVGGLEGSHGGVRARAELLARLGVETRR